MTSGLDLERAVAAFFGSSGDRLALMIALRNGLKCGKVPFTLRYTDDRQPFATIFYALAEKLAATDRADLQDGYIALLETNLAILKKGPGKKRKKARRRSNGDRDFKRDAAGDRD